MFVLVVFTYLWLHSSLLKIIECFRLFGDFSNLSDLIIYVQSIIMQVKKQLKVRFYSNAMRLNNICFWESMKYVSLLIINIPNKKELFINVLYLNI